MAHNTQWYLNDYVINDYFELIKKRDPSIYCFDTFFFENYKNFGYSRVKSWTKNINIFSKRKLFFPINIKRRNIPPHWILVVVDINHNQITGYDSLKKSNLVAYRDDVLKYLEEEHLGKLGESLPIDNWEKVQGENPYQENGIDCGVYVCIFAEYISRDVAFNFDQDFMAGFRKLMAYELCTKQLINI
ncbi:sentrin-specific protease 1-like [Acyrthosiphon pisum]|uniref:Ubiquitin-like protease family profile domain-containing protein n=1 Tax=Acyrthosiphon pisum TaxID=7029 RepID=A0A8R2B2H6_ACYPI|nr:sentrin-specific protease 1-like [Acyrthosiphon pisum]|eukprot:XP_008179339.1 PREDICTED: sentrin-specific protease 1-like [Acyrthosiphon pisum]